MSTTINNKKPAVSSKAIIKTTLGPLMPNAKLAGFEPEQFRLTRLQVFNWGTFCGYHDIPVSAKGFLFTGKSGTGKSTLLDAMTSVLVPPRLADFNAAARDASSTGRDRDWVSYIRGAWGEQRDEESGKSVTRYRRPDGTWSALSMTYQNGRGETVQLVQIFTIRGTSTAKADIKKKYLMLTQEIALTSLEPFAESGFSGSTLRAMLPDAVITNEFSEYCQAFMQRLGIENEKALHLLHKTQSAKNLTDLNAFMRDFMLERPDTFEDAEALVSEFTELNSAHEAVVKASKQVEVLTPAYEAEQLRIEVLGRKTKIDEMLSSLFAYGTQRRARLIDAELKRLAQEESLLQSELDALEVALINARDELRNLENLQRAQGGSSIEAMEDEKRLAEKAKAAASLKLERAKELAQSLSLLPFSTLREFIERQADIKKEAESLHDVAQQLREQRDALVSEQSLRNRNLLNLQAEIAALKKQPSNIPTQLVTLREKLCAETGVAVASLPFAGELMEVKREESEWQGAMERLLSGFGQSLLVPEKHHAVVANYLNANHLGLRLVYHKVGKAKAVDLTTLDDNSVIHKLSFAEHDLIDWVKSKLIDTLDYQCVNDVPSLNKVDRGLTREGMMKHGGTRHEKNDRFAINDKRHWVLGFDNADKVAMLEAEGRICVDECHAGEKLLAQLTKEQAEHKNREMLSQRFSELSWSDLDTSGFEVRIKQLDKAIADIRKNNTSLAEIATKIEKQTAKTKKASSAFDNKESEINKLRNVVKSYTDQRTKLDASALTTSIDAEHMKSLDTRMAANPEALDVTTIGPALREIESTLKEEINALQVQAIKCLNVIEKAFSQFLTLWPEEKGNLSDTIDCAPDFFAKLDRLTADALPKFKDRFAKLLREQSQQRLVSLQTSLTSALRDILRKMEPVNESLQQVEFNKGTYLQIETNQKAIESVTQFREDIAAALDNAWEEDDETAEAHFQALKKLVLKLASQEPDMIRWRNLVLDVRLHVDFSTRESDKDGNEIETLRSTAGKSGGQRQKLATSCLAAALRYQLGGRDGHVPSYATVILDEAFDKADSEFTETAMRIFANFGFQMIVATPLKSIMTLEPFIGGAAMIDITNRNESGFMLIEYDSESQCLVRDANTDATDQDDLQAA